MPSTLDLQSKLLAQGDGALSEAELLALALQLPSLEGIRQAEYLLSQVGSVNAVLQSDVGALCRYKSVTVRKFAQFKATLALQRRAWQRQLAEISTDKQPQTLRAFVWEFLQSRRREAFYVLFLDVQHRLLGDEVLFEGTLNAAFVYPREVVKRSLEWDAVAVILAHNHPSGCAEPSEADRQITQTLQQALSLVDVRVLDHFVVGEGRMVSFSERGWL